MQELITSRQNARIKAVAKLRNARERRKQGRILIDGVREISRALDAGVEVVEAFLCEELTSDASTGELVRRLPAAGTSLVTPEVFDKICFGARRDGVVVVARTPQISLEQLRLSPQPLVAVLVGLEKPGNVGAILRTADGAGLDAVIVVDGGTDLFNPNTIRASLGTVFAANVCTATSDACVAKLREWQVPIVATRPDAPTQYCEVDYPGGAAIVLGSEAVGLDARWQGQDLTAVNIPMRGRADSLNVSATAAVMFYEALRQRANSMLQPPGGGQGVVQ